jgi:hypothetical protein
MGKSQRFVITSKRPHFLDNLLTVGDETVSLAGRPRFTSQEDSWCSFLLEAESTLRAILRLVGLGILKSPVTSGIEPAVIRSRMI